NAFGVMYGGALAFLADATILLSAATTVPTGTAFNTIDLKLYFLRPVVPADGVLVARGKVVHRGCTIAVVACEITGPDGALVAQATGSVLILPGRHWERPVRVADEMTADTTRVLTSLLFVDLVDSTQRAAQIGDARWRTVLADYHALVREQIRRFRGREIDTAGDGFFIAFDSAARAIQCAAAVRDGVRRLDLDVRCGIHAGECEESAGKLVGIAVHIGARVGAAAQPGEILVSSTVRDIVVGSGIAFEDRGEHALKGIAGSWQLYAAST
ncbi:MAG TPA: hotdog fold thioesterase, partial [Candidatus Tumulicola sp.]|nr:hotdog fold thioesterase [Candidatus Tumulicola sp.]